MSFLIFSAIIYLLSTLGQRHSEIEDAEDAAYRLILHFAFHNLCQFSDYIFVVLKMEKPHISTSALCRTLAHALKRLFKSVKAQNAVNPLNAPVDIIRRDVSRSSYLPRISQVSLFPEFECPSADHDGLADYVPSLPMPLQPSSTNQASQKTLLPAKSLSHFNLRHIYTDQSESPVVRSRREVGFPLGEPTIHPSKVISQKPVLVSKSSTLQIRRPESLHATISNASIAASFISGKPSSSIRRTNGSCDLRKCAKTDSLTAETAPLTSIAENSRSSGSTSSHGDPSHLVRHFASFCIIDIAAPGCPVSAVSEDLRYLYDIKDRFVLNAQQCSELSMDLSIGRDPSGNEVTYVLLFSPLISPATTRTRFMLVSAIDVSGYVRCAASLESNLEPIAEVRPLRSFREKPNPGRKVSSRSWIDERTDRLADELLHGCSIKDTSNSNVPGRPRASHMTDLRRSDFDSEDVWTAIAREGGLKPREPSAATKSIVGLHSASDPPLLRRQKQATVPPIPKSNPNHGDEKVLERFIESLQVLYSQYFLLACSPLNGQFYEICYVSPAVYASGEYVSGHLSHTSFHLIDEFGAHLAAGRRFRTTILWGSEGVAKQLYCVPLMGHQPTPWICMLVDKETPIHW
jgi:hypothetical protein